jgi:hypothetical protein
MEKTDNMLIEIEIFHILLSIKLLLLFSYFFVIAIFQETEELM